MAQPNFSIDVAYAMPEHQDVVTLQVTAGTTVAQAIQQSGLLQRYPEINLAQQAVGIFSEKVSLETLVKAGDRIEIYRPLVMDPKEARFARLKMRKNKKY